MTYFEKEAWARVLAHEDAQLDAPTTAASIAVFETEHGVALPEAHREFLMKGNGGGVGYVRLFGVGRKDGLDLDRQVREMRAELERTAEGPVLPFASDWGGGYFCYDLRKPLTARGYPVLYWNHEYSEEPDDRPLLWSNFAPDFVAFVEQVVQA